MGGISWDLSKRATRGAVAKGGMGGRMDAANVSLHEGRNEASSPSPMAVRVVNLKLRIEIVVGENRGYWIRCDRQHQYKMRFDRGTHYFNRLSILKSGNLAA